MKRARLFVLPVVSVLAACIAAPTRGHPLYVSPVPLRTDQVAILAGYVATVDGHDVTGLRPVELLPGCHVVTTPITWSKGSPTTGLAVSTTGPLTFVLPMQGGRRYTLSGTTSGGRVYIRALETTAEGTAVSTTGPVLEGQEGEIVACVNAGAVNNYPHGD